MPPRRSGGLEGQRGHNIQSDDIEQPLLDEEDDAKTPPARPKRKTVIQEACDILYLAGPIFIAMFSWVGMKTTDTALLGHVGTEKLSASALSDLWTTSTGVFVQGRVLGMFCGQAFGMMSTCRTMNVDSLSLTICWLFWCWYVFSEYI
eukprot:m.1137073 g.1137073  ORF g.1137073 m.1137073 type:complete len:148 (-) comp24434_c3_seq2:178-621(-)